MQHQAVIQNFPDFDSVDAGTLQDRLVAMLDRHRERIRAIEQEAEVSWETIAQPMEDMSDELNRFWSPVSHLNSVMNSDELRAAYNACLPLLSQYSSEIGQNQNLQAAYEKLSRSEDFAGLETARQKAIQNTLRDFHLAGVDLPEDQKSRYREISSRLSELSSRFSDQVLDATQAWTRHFEQADALAGLPETALEAAAEAARSKSLSGYLVTLEFPSYYAVMTYADDRQLRRETYEAYATRASEVGPNAGEYDNAPLMVEILKLRQEKAALLGFQNYAEYSLATKMARKTDEVVGFLRELADKSRQVAQQDLEELSAFARSQGAEELKAWDISYWSEKFRQEKYSISQEALKPYFPADRVVEGMFDVVERLFNVTLEEAQGLSTYHPEVRVYHLRQEGEVVASIYMDLYARSRKRGGAWMADYAVRRRLGEHALQLPVAFITCNFSRPTGGRPALLTHDEVTTLFHEFGHALHHMLTRVDTYDVSGINGVAWDAVELPSQFLENWCWQEEAIPLISGHYETGEPLPADLLQKMLAARNFQSGLMMVRQLEFALFDFLLHLQYNGEDASGIQALLDQVRQEVSVIPVPEFNRFQNSFGHIFAGGYAAGYYSYKWAEVLSADAFSLFEEEGIFDQSTGHHFRDTILASGGSVDPLELFISFRGREPDVAALLRHNGIIEAA